jgi:hypothetical protein
VKPTKLIALAAVALGLALLAGEARAQGPGPHQRREGPRAGLGRRGAGPGGEDRRAAQQLFLRVAKLPPAEQRPALEADELFQRLPPFARERFLQRLDEFNAMPEERRRQMLARGEGALRMQAAQQLFLRVAPLTAEEQEQALVGDAEFREMPPMMQQRFRQHLEEFNRRPPEERERMLGRMQRFAELSPQEQERMRQRARLFALMTPEQRQQALQTFQAWQQVPPARRQLIIERLRGLQQSPFDMRATLLNDEEFLAPLDDNERRLLRSLWELRGLLPPAPPPPDPGPVE